jgi:hypothetical protein
VDMTVFISHSSRDAAAVGSLVQHLTAARESVWLDQSLSGGEAWWSRVLDQIRSCSVFVVALSNNALHSKPCRAEMGYAKALGLPILPVQIGDVDSYRLDPIFTVQLVDYRNPDVAAGMGLIAALRERAGERGALPDPLPEPPPIPYEYLQRLGMAVDSPEELSPTEQSTMFLELRRALRDEDDDSVGEDIRRLLRALRRRSEVTYAIVSEIDELLRTDAAPGVAADGQGPRHGDGGPASGAQAHDAERGAVGSGVAAAGQGARGDEPGRSGAGAIPQRFDAASITAADTDAQSSATEEPVSEAVSLDHADERPASPSADTVPNKPRWWLRRTSVAIAAGVAVVVAIIAIIGYLHTGRPSPPATPKAAPPVAVAALDGLLLNTDQINTAMGTTGMTIAATFTALADDAGNVPDKACLPASQPPQTTVYAGSGWTATRQRLLQEPGDISQRTHFAVEAVVLFSSAHDAAAFFTASAQSWPACSNRRYTFTQAGQPDSVWTVGPISNTNATLSSTKTLEGGNGWTCERALTVSNNVVIDVVACSYNQTDAAVNIAHQIATKVPTK